MWAVLPVAEQNASGTFHPVIPKLWYDKALRAMTLRPVCPEGRIVDVSSEYFYRTAGLASEPAIERRVQFLLETQLADGSWHVRRRSYRVQANYFDTGLPHGRDQRISAAGTSWAVIGLSLATKL
jgi:squalene cyclase